MKLEPVNSTNLKATGHDPDNNLMVVEFQDSVTKAGTKPGGIYQYPDVTAEEHEALRNAVPSIGSHFQTHFVKTRKPFTRLR
jgi:hypothetical protein